MSWWKQLDPARRGDLLTLSPQAHLPEDLAHELRSFGVDVAHVGLALRLGARTSTSYAQPTEVREFLTAARHWAAMFPEQPR